MKLSSIYNFVPFIFLVSLVLISSCSDDETSPNPVEENATIWTGADLTFTKADGADPTLEANQDRLTDNVWITRGNGGGQIFNVQSESSADKDNSPSGTRWAIGNINNIDQLQFQRFRDAVGSPRDVVGEDLVLFLQEDNIYLSVRFTSWSQGGEGGFSYMRSTP